MVNIRQHLTSTLKPFRALPLRILRSIGNSWADKGIPKSPLPHLLTSNVTPSDSEIVTIRALIAEVEVRIEELHHNNFPGSQGYRVSTTQIHSSTQGITESRSLSSLRSPAGDLSPLLRQRIYQSADLYGALAPRPHLPSLERDRFGSPSSME